MAPRRNAPDSQFPLKMTRDEWPNYICCVLTVRQELIDQNPGLVQDLVNYVQGAGHWLDAEREHRARAAEIAATTSTSIKTGQSSNTSWITRPTA